MNPGRFGEIVGAIVVSIMGLCLLALMVVGTFVAIRHLLGL